MYLKTLNPFVFLLHQYMLEENILPFYIRVLHTKLV